MRKLFNLILLSACIAITASCSSLDDCANDNNSAVIGNQETLNVAYEKLNSTITSINNSYCMANSDGESSNAKTIRRISFWKRVARFFCTVCADVAGTVQLSLFSDGKSPMNVNVKNGIDCSIAVWKALEDKEKGKEETPQGTDGNKKKIQSAEMNVQINPNAIPTLNGNKLEDNVGFVHNKVILNLYEKYGEGLDSLSESDLEKEIDVEYCKVILQNNLIVPEGIADDINSEYIAHICNVISECEDIDDFIEMLKNEHPDCQRELDILKTSMEALFSNSLSEESVDTYTGDVIDAIDASEVPYDSKRLMKSAIGVASGSSQLWILH